MVKDEHHHHEIDAKVVAVDPKIEPIKSVVVADRRNLLGRRLGTFAVAILILFFAISGDIQSARNGELLKRAAIDRSHLIDSVNDLTASNHSQSRLIERLQEALKAQNKILRDNGIKVVPVPNDSNSSFIPAPTSSTPNGSPEPSSSASSESPRPTSSPQSSPSTTPNPNPSPTPSQDPLQRVEDRVCSLTGICTPIPIFFRF